MEYLEHQFDDITALTIEACASEFSKLCFNFTDKCWNKSKTDGVLYTENGESEVTNFVMNQNNFIEEFDIHESSRFINQNIDINGNKVRHFSGAPLILFSGEVIGAICVMDTKPRKLTTYQKSMLKLIARDVVSQIEKVNKQNEHNEMAKLHKVLNEEFDEFFHSASHDLKSPVNAIKNVIAWIEEDSASGITEDLPKHYQMIKNSVARMNRLLKGFGSYAQVRGVGNTTENISLKALVDDCCKALSVSDNFVFEVDDCLIELPRPHLQIILSQLISNAVKHHDKGEGHIKVRCISNVNNYELSVIDDGPGIPAELQVKIFKPFQTLKSKDEMESTGLGLAIVKKMMRLYSGEVFVESKVNFGATFTVVWPKNKTSQNDQSTITKAVSHKGV